MTASAEGRAPDERIKMTVSERSASELAEGLTGWLAARLGEAEQAAGGRPDAITGLTVRNARFSGSGGLSSTSVLFEAGWVSGGAERHGRYVARLAPEASAVPVFPRYDLATQFEVISQVAARSDVPVPAVRWYEPGERVLGSPFFVMDQVDGLVPLDNPPYVFTGWLLEATAAQLGRCSGPASRYWPGCTRSPSPRRCSPRSARPAARTRCAGMSASSASTTAGHCPATASGCRSSSAAWTGWPSTGHATPARTC